MFLFLIIVGSIFPHIRFHIASSPLPVSFAPLSLIFSTLFSIYDTPIWKVCWVFFYPQFVVFWMPFQPPLMLLLIFFTCTIFLKIYLPSQYLFVRNYKSFLTHTSSLPSITSLSYTLNRISIYPRPFFTIRHSKLITKKQKKIPIPIRGHDLCRHTYLLTYIIIITRDLSRVKCNGVA